jgi:hypothetical protein
MSSLIAPTLKEKDINKERGKRSPRTSGQHKIEVSGEATPQLGQINLHVLVCKTLNKRKRKEGKETLLETLQNIEIHHFRHVKGTSTTFLSNFLT